MPADHATVRESTSRPIIPLARPNITQVEIDAVVSVLRSPHLSLGPKLEEFEQAISHYCGLRNAVACSSGTAGLHLLVRALGVKPGDEVVTTPFSFIASANCVLMEGATPVFVDIDDETWMLDPDRIERAVNSKTKAIIPVDVFGQVADMTAIEAVAARHGLRIIEDSCEALGGRFRNRPAGSFGDAGVFGFYPNKQITTGEGGMIVTDNDEIAVMCRSMRNQGRDTNGGWLAHPRLGFNYRMSDINCALGIAQLGRIDEIVSNRNRVEAAYRERLRGEPRIRLQRIAQYVEPSWFVFVVRLVDDYTPADRDRILLELRGRGVECSNYFAPIHLQPFYAERFGYEPGAFPVCEALAARTIALPLHHELSEKDVEVVCETLRDML